MDPQTTFALVAVGSFALPCMGAGVIALLGWPRSLPTRVIGSIVVGWVISVMYTMFAYNPAGIAASVETPALRFDNNTVASALLGGWILPTIAVAMALGVRALLRKARSTPRQ